jgi:hypothetical protein
MFQLNSYFTRRPINSSGVKFISDTVHKKYAMRNLRERVRGCACEGRYLTIAQTANERTELSSSLLF